MADPQDIVDASLGVDPGADGAATMLSPRRGLLASAVWRKRQRKGADVYRVELLIGEELEPHEEDAVAFWEIGQIILRRFARVPGVKFWNLWTESAFLGKNPMTALAGAQRSGALQAPLESRAHGYQGLWVSPWEWRKTVLNLSTRVKSDEAKAASLKWIPTIDLPGLATAVERWSGADHFTDSVGVALHGATVKGDLPPSKIGGLIKAGAALEIEPPAITKIRESLRRP